MRIYVSDTIGKALKAAERQFVKAAQTAVKDAAEGLRNELRQQTQRALGTRVSNAWRLRFYENPGDPRGPAALVYSKAPRIIDFYSAQRVVRPTGGAFAIPVNPVIERRGRRATIAEVEQKFGKLQAVRLPTGNIGLFAQLIRAKSGKGYRSPTRGRLRQGRSAEMVMMFVLVRSLRSRKLIDLEGAAGRWAERVPEAIARVMANANWSPPANWND